MGTEFKQGGAGVRYREIKPGYRVGDDGSAWSCKRGGGNRPGELTDRWRRLRPQPGRRGYLRVLLGHRLREDGRRVTDRRAVHRLVLEAFVGPCPPGLECRHLDGDKTNNRRANLAWGTHEENMADMVRHGRSNRGERCPTAKLTEADVYAALASRRAGGRIVDIARGLGVAPCTVRQIFRGERWTHLTDVAGLPPRRADWVWSEGEGNSRAVLTEADVRKALSRRAAGESIASIARRFGVDPSTIRNLLGGRTWRHITSVTGLPPRREDPKPNVVLTASDVLEALARHRAGEQGVAIARRLGVSDSTIGRIFSGESWGHVTGVPRRDVRRRRARA